MNKDVIKVPDIGDFEEVEVIEILVNLGEKIQIEQPIITIESDKATMDIPSPIEGELHEINVNLGDKISEGETIATILTSNETTNSSHDKQSTSQVEQDNQSSDEVLSTNPRQRISGDNLKPKGALQPSVSEAIISHASPSIRKFARELGVDIEKVIGTGKANRIKQEDVQRYVKDSIKNDKSIKNKNALTKKIKQLDHSKFGPTEPHSLSKIQLTSAEHMALSWRTIPHVFHFDEADITDVERFRKNKIEEYKKKGTKLTLLTFITKAVARCLELYPIFNSSLDENGENLVLKKYVNIGVAVNTPKGLVVPVLKNANNRTLVDIAQGIQSLSEQARNQTIKLDDLSGSTFTISNLGGVGGKFFTPIINHPEVAIAGISPSKIQPIWRESNFVPRLILPLSISYDHRAIDGALAAQFTSKLCALLADIRELLL